MAAATGVWEGERGAGCRAEDSHYQQRKQKAKVCPLFPENGSMGLGTWFLCHYLPPPGAELKVGRTSPRHSGY